MPYAARYIKIDNIEVPTGELGVVANTPFDFTTPKQIGRDIENALGGCGYNCTGYDQAFILDRPVSTSPDSAEEVQLRMRSPDTGIQVEIRTNQQSLQVYSCDNLDGTVPVKESQRHGGGGGFVEKYGCVVIETQQWIDGVNHPEWGQLGRQVFSPETGPVVVWAEYAFSTVG